MEREGGEETAHDPHGVSVSNEECPICYEGEEGDRGWYILNCHHKLHRHCAEGLRKLECPLCRARITTLPPDLMASIQQRCSEDEDERTQTFPPEILTALQHIETMMRFNNYRTEVLQAYETLHVAGIPHIFFPVEVVIRTRREMPLAPQGALTNAIISTILHYVRSLLLLPPEEEENGENGDTDTESEDGEEFREAEQENVVRSIRFDFDFEGPERT